MSQNILDEIEPPRGSLYEAQQKANLFFRQTLKMALATAVVLVIFLIICWADFFKISSYNLRIFIPFGGLIFLIASLFVFIAAYYYGEQKSIINFQYIHNQRISSSFYNLLYSLITLFILAVLWKWFSYYQPTEVISIGPDNSENIDVPAGWWRPYRKLVTMLFLVAILLWGLCSILFLCLHTHEKTLDLDYPEAIKAYKFKQLLFFLGLMICTIVGIFVLEHYSGLREQYRLLAKLFGIRRDELSLGLVLYVIPLFIAQWLVYVKKPQHL